MLFVFRCWLTGKDCNTSFFYDIKSPSDQMLTEEQVLRMYRRNFGVDPEEHEIKVLSIKPLTYLANPETVKYRKKPPKKKDLPFSPLFGYLETPYFNKHRSKEKAKRDCYHGYIGEDLLKKYR